MENNLKDKFSESNLEGTLFRLLNEDSAKSMDSGNLLVLMGLVNLMGLIDIINLKMENKNTSSYKDISSLEEKAVEIFKGDKKQEKPIDTANLMDMLNQFLKPKSQAKETSPDS